MKPYSITLLCPTSDSFAGDKECCTITLNAGDDDTQPPFIQIEGYMSFDNLAHATDELTTIIEAMHKAWTDMGGTP